MPNHQEINTTSSIITTATATTVSASRSGGREASGREAKGTIAPAATGIRGKYYYFIIFMVNCEPSFGKMNLFHIMSDP